MLALRIRLVQNTLIAFGIMSGGLVGCMVGPNFRAPHAPITHQYTASIQPKKTVGNSISDSVGKPQYFLSKTDIPAEWWRLFHSSALNQLICAGIANSPNLNAAEAALREAQETLTAQIGNSLFPSVNAQLSGERQQLSAASPNLGTSSSIPVFSLYNASVNVSYLFDLFGGARRQVEAVRAQVDYQRFQLEAAYLTLTANIVTSAVTLASTNAQIQATRALIHAQENQLAITQKQLQLGGIAESALLSLQTQLSQTRAKLPPLEKVRAQTQHALAVLVGRLPSDASIPSLSLDSLTLPTQLPLSLPAYLVRQRPDIRASEALLHAASAQVGVATANLLPQITLTGAYGTSATSPGMMSSSSANFWNYGGQLIQPIFNAGALRAQRRAAIAAYEQAHAQYRQTVLQAFQNVADTLRALEFDAQTLRLQRQAEIASQRALRLTQTQYRLGGTSYLALLNAQQQYEQTRISRLQAQAARYTDTAALFQALGGGWWNRLQRVH